MICAFGSRHFDAACAHFSTIVPKIPVHDARIRNARGLPRDVRDKIMRGVEWRVRPLASQPVSVSMFGRCPWGASRPPCCSWPASTCIELYIPESVLRCCCADNANMYSGELQHAQRVLALCGKGRGGATASETLRVSFRVKM